MTAGARQSMALLLARLECRVRLDTASYDLGRTWVLVSLSFSQKDSCGWLAGWWRVDR